MAGLDVVDGQIIEINVTSPCYFIKEINNNFCTHIEKKICDFILSGAKELNIPDMSTTESYRYRTEIV